MWGVLTLSSDTWNTWKLANFFPRVFISAASWIIVFVCFMHCLSGCIKRWAVGWSLTIDRSEWPTAHTPQRTIPRGTKTTNSHKAQKLSQLHAVALIVYMCFNSAGKHTHTQDENIFRYTNSNSFTHTCTLTHTDCGPNSGPTSLWAAWSPALERALHGAGRFLIIRAHYKHLFLLS